MENPPAKRKLSVRSRLFIETIEGDNDAGLADLLETFSVDLNETIPIFRKTMAPLHFMPILLYALQRTFFKIFKHLLLIPEVDPNALDSIGNSIWDELINGPLNTHLEFLTEFVRCDRVKINVRTGDLTPVSHAVLSGEKRALQIMIASGKILEMPVHLLGDKVPSRGRTHKCSIFRLEETRRMAVEYTVTPKECIKNIRKELKWITDEARLLGYIVFICDDLLKIRERRGLRKEGRTKRFFRIAVRLPFELQMLLSNRCYSSLSRTLVPLYERELGFACVAREVSIKK